MKNKYLHAAITYLDADQIADNAYVYRDDATGQNYVTDADDLEDLGAALTTALESGGSRADTYSEWCSVTGHPTEDEWREANWGDWTDEQVLPWIEKGWTFEAAEEAVDVHGADPDSPPPGSPFDWTCARFTGMTWDDWATRVEEEARREAELVERRKRRLAGI